jgi:hypothetical protein
MSAVKRGYAPHFNRTIAYDIYYHEIYIYDIYFYGSILLQTVYTGLKKNFLETLKAKKM